MRVEAARVAPDYFTKGLLAILRNMYFFLSDLDGEALKDFRSEEYYSRIYILQSTPKVV